MANGNKTMLNLNLPSQKDLRLVRAILRYEASTRKSTMAQACLDLVVQGADVRQYPSELRSRIDEIDARGRRRALARVVDEIRSENVA